MKISLKLMLVRAVTLMLETIDHFRMGYEFYHMRVLHVSQALMDMPTLLYMTSFSIFIYYFAKLTMQVESMKSKHFYQEEELSHGVATFDEKRQLLLDSSGYKANNGSPVNKKKYQMPNLIKPFFIIFNIFTYCTYIIICVYCTTY